MVDATSDLRQIEPTWNVGLVTASIAISLLGAFTSTQLICQARMSLHFTSALSWTILAALAFGFASIWGLHFVATLACEMDVRVGIDVGLTILSAVLAFVFTFLGIGADLLYEKWHRGRKHGRRRQKRENKRTASTAATTNASTPARRSDADESTVPLLGPLTHADLEEVSRDLDDEEHVQQLVRPGIVQRGSSHKSLLKFINSFDETARERAADQIEGGPNGILKTLDMPAASPQMPPIPSPTAMERNDPMDGSWQDYMSSGDESSVNRSSSDYSGSRRSSSNSGTGMSTGLSSLMNLAHIKQSEIKNPFAFVAKSLWLGLTFKNIVRGLFMSLAITSMHYSGIFALRLPHGHITLNPWLVILSAVISWIVCCVGCILMSSMETNIMQQVLFSIVATVGVAAMHFTGMQAARFWTRDGPSDIRGYPHQLATAVVSIAIFTCLLANGLLTHAAMVSRNKLAEIVWTRKKLWQTIAQKENAEQAAAARSDFIASASHEIRTPLHHLQGYSDLLSRTELTEEGRVLLYAIQRATKTLSLITNNVLDWSKLERDSGSLLRPVALDMRSVCESIMILLPNKDEDLDVEVMVCVSPDVPHSLFLDETYIHRILMNLLSNALKFVRTGFVLLSLSISPTNELVASVQDTGSGVPPSFLPELFEPFKQAQTRGNQRGTGLGLSIVKQLLHKMNGNIEVESRHPEMGEVAPEDSGSTFTVRIPLQTTAPIPRHLSLFGSLPTIAMFFTGNQKCLEGLRMAWAQFGYATRLVNHYEELSTFEFRYIWADQRYLEEHPSMLKRLLKQEEWIMLVPYDQQNMLARLPGLLSSPRCVPLQRPLMWHTFETKIALAEQSPTKNGLGRSVRFASKVDILDGKDQEDVKAASTSKNLTVLMVEDNPINQKLGHKMLTSLGYAVLLAENGQSGLDTVVQHDTLIDLILMDQSMPIKDGVTATKEIRALEANGTLTKRHFIVALTAVVNTESRALFKAAGADDFLGKPLGLRILESTLATFLKVE